MAIQQSSARATFDYRNFGAFRLLLAVMVVLQHFFASFAPERAAVFASRYEIGSIAVLAFFALSGFVIVEAADSLYIGRPKAFFGNRLLRIFPHFLVACFLALAFFSLLDKAPGLKLPHNEGGFSRDMALTPENIILNFLGVLPLTDRFMSFNFITIAWAVRVEMVFYLVVAMALLTAAWLARRQILPEREAFAVTAFALATLLIPLCALAIAGRGIALFQYLPYFTFGCALYYVVTRGGPVPLTIAIISLSGVAWQFLSLPDHHPTLGYARAAHAQFAILIALIATMTILARRPTRRFERVDRAFGNLTYPLYMDHRVVALLIASLFTTLSYLSIAIAIAVSFTVAWFAHRTLDPMVDRLRNQIRGRKL